MRKYNNAILYGEYISTIFLSVYSSTIL